MGGRDAEEKNLRCTDTAGKGLGIFHFIATHVGVCIGEKCRDR